MELVEWDALKPEVERLLGRRVSRPEWVAVVKMNSDNVYPDDPHAAAELAAELRSIYAVADAPREPAGRFARPDDKLSRVRALSAVFAAEAAQLDEVRDFRASALPDGLLKHQDCAAWILDRREKPDPGSFVLLDYAPPDAGWTHRIAVARDSVLGDLARLSERLADMFGWEAQQATIFVLSNAIPIVTPVRSTVRFKGPIAAASRVILEIDPWTDPRDVEAAYRRARREYAGEDARYRQLGERALTLATFVAERPDEPDEKRRRAWNRAHKDWQYDDARSFARAYRAATDRLLDPKIR